MVFLQGTEQMLKHWNACGRSTCGTKISQRIWPVGSLLIGSETIQPLVDLLATPEVGLPRAFRC